jgi:hypothetical protein
MLRTPLTVRRVNMQVRVHPPKNLKDDGTTLMHVEIVAVDLLKRKAALKPGEAYVSPFMLLGTDVQKDIEQPSESIEHPFLGLELPAEDTGNDIVRRRLARDVQFTIKRLRDARTVKYQARQIETLYVIEQISQLLP